MKYALAIILWLALLPSAWAQGVFSTLGIQPTYAGPGDVISYSAFYGLRAFSKATLGNKLVNACNSTGGADQGACGDLFSSPTTGAIVPALVGTPSITCPGNTNCTIKTAYDLTGNGNDATQATVASRAKFQTSAFGGAQTCLLFSGGQAYQSAGLAPAASYPLTITYVAERTSVFTTINGVFGLFLTGTTLPSAGFSATANALSAFAGTTANTSAIFPDNNPYAVQTLISSTNGQSSITANGTLVSGLSTGLTAPKTTVILGGQGGQSLNGILCETGFVNGDQTANNANITTNQRNFYGF